MCIFPFVTVVRCNAEAGEEQRNSEDYSRYLRHQHYWSHI